MRNGTPEKINIEKSGANAAAIVSYNAEHGTSHPQMMGFKSCNAAQNALTCIELRQMIRKGLMEAGAKGSLNTADQFYAVAS